MVVFNELLKTKGGEMKVLKGIVVVALVMSIAGAASASSIAAKVWYADANELEDPALHYGLTGSLGLGESMWISGMFLTGTFDDGLGTDIDVESTDAEIILGGTYDMLDFGVGMRYSQWTFGDSAVNDEFIYGGPTVYLGLGNTIGDTPVGWYVGGTYMFFDLGDAYDDDWEDTYEHWNVEGGLFLAMGSVSATIGYRYKDFVNYDDSEIAGIAGSLGFGF